MPQSDAEIAGNMCRTHLPTAFSATVSYDQLTAALSGAQDTRASYRKAVELTPRPQNRAMFRTQLATLFKMIDHIEARVLMLGEQHKDDLDKVAGLTLSHIMAHRKDRLVVQIPNYVKDSGLTVSKLDSKLYQALQGLANLEAKSSLQASLIAREAFIACHIPSIPITEQESDVRELIDLNYILYNVLLPLFKHQGSAASLASLEVCVCRVYRAYSPMSIDLEKGDDDGDSANTVTSHFNFGRSSCSPSTFEYFRRQASVSELTYLIDRNQKQPLFVGAIASFTGLKSFNRGFDRVAEMFPVWGPFERRQRCNGNIVPPDVLNYALRIFDPKDDMTEGKQFRNIVELVNSHKETLESVVFVVSPSSFAARACIPCTSPFVIWMERGEQVIRRIEPALALQLELSRLSTTPLHPSSRRASSSTRSRQGESTRQAIRHSYLGKMPETHAHGHCSITDSALGAALRLIPHIDLPSIPPSILFTMERFVHVDTLEFLEDSANALAFSPDSRLLAIGMDDESLWIYNPRTRHIPLHIITCTPTTALLWHPEDAYAIFVGGGDGSCKLHILNKEASLALRCLEIPLWEKDEEPSGDKDPVECFDYDGPSQCLALIVRCKVAVSQPMNTWEPYETTTRSNKTYGLSLSSILMLYAPDEQGIAKWRTITLPDPQVGSDYIYPNGADRRIRPRSLHFADDGRSLIVSYLNHGIICWDIATGSRKWNIVASSQLGRSVLTRDGRYLVVHNLSSGFDKYDLQIFGKVHHYPAVSPAANNVPLPIICMDNDVLLFGSSTGGAKLTDLSGQIEQTLRNPALIVQSLASCHLEDEKYIALGASEQPPYVTIWRVQAEGNAQLASITTRSDATSAPRRLAHDEDLPSDVAGRSSSARLVERSEWPGATFIEPLNPYSSADLHKRWLYGPPTQKVLDGLSEEPGTVEQHEILDTSLTDTSDQGGNNAIRPRVTLLLTERIRSAARRFSISHLYKRKPTHPPSDAPDLVKIYTPTAPSATASRAPRAIKAIIFPFPNLSSWLLWHVSCLGSKLLNQGMPKNQLAAEIRTRSDSPQSYSQASFSAGGSAGEFSYQGFCQYLVNYLEEEYLSAECEDLLRWWNMYVSPESFYQHST
ncbi:hypothetical protein NM688_g2469 [Phlebia brevispora]|uniref:Uncharacterized protein n=1 Tax=Phlebia brevispora TaxID=194682 RepID=A0ACC1T8S6_9APHY|nr:hypothetical protein NM688_g2469 [Phlebia brevispora]